MSEVPEGKGRMGRHMGAAVYGANDGIITTFAVVSGGVGASLTSETIIILGVASLVADGFSMGASSYLSLVSERDTDHAQHGESDVEAPVLQGATTFAAFLVAGILPLVPFFFGVAEESRFLVSAVATGVTLFVIGSLRTILTKQPIIRSGLEMLLIGGVAAAIAYGIGWWIEAMIV
jgi:VIT1/CCC1 family predicted Fe2+/Mn2+ transporter